MTRVSIHDILSRFNHSCIPNVHHCSDNSNRTFCVVIRPVKEGDQMFINYCGPMKFTNDSDRRQYLKENWEFDCSCEKCCSKLQINGRDELDQSYLNIKQNFDKMSTTELKTECVRFLDKYGRFWSKSVEFVMDCMMEAINES